MSPGRAGEARPAARRMPPLCLLLLPLLLPPLSGATASLPLGDGLAGHDSHSGRQQEVAETKKNSLWTLLARWYQWTSRAGLAPAVRMRGEAGAAAKRQDSTPPQLSPQHSARADRVPCRNFFWKTFSSCK